jgi:hypothetical protein
LFSALDISRARRSGWRNPERHEESYYMDSGSFGDERTQVQCRGANVSRRTVFRSSFSLGGFLGRFQRSAGGHLEALYDARDND